MLSYFAIAVLFNGCSAKEEEPLFNTELVCPQISYRILILKVTKEDVMFAIQQAAEYRKKGGNNSKYTVLYFPDNQTTSIYNITPEELGSCQINQLTRGVNKGYRKWLRQK